MLKQLLKKFLIPLWGPKAGKQTRYYYECGKVWLLKKIYRSDSNALRINIGGGRWYQKYWVNIDLYAPRVYCDYKIDLRDKRPFPIKDSVAQLIFSSHVFEHVSDDVCAHVLNECHRILKYGGTMRIVVPDMDKALEAYKRKDQGFFNSGEIKLTGDTLERKLVNYFASYKRGIYSGGPVVSAGLVKQKLSLFNKYEFIKWCVSLIPKDAYYVAHVNGYDFEKLYVLLKQAGFEKIEKSTFQKSSVSEMRGKGFDHAPLISLYVEATK